MTMIGTYALYLAVCGLALLFARYSETSGKRRGLVMAVVMLALLQGLRAYSVGVDTASYQTGIEYFFVHNKTSSSVGFATGYGYFTKAVLTIYHNYTFLLLVQAFITNGLILARFWDYRDVSSLTFMVFVYVCQLYFYSFNLVCQTLAMSIFFYFTRYLDKGKPVICCIGIALASCIHLSALIGIGVVLLRYMQFRNVSARRALVQLLILAVGVVVVLYAANLLVERYAKYAGGTSVGLMFAAQLLVLVGSLLLCGYFSGEKERNGLVPLRTDLRERAPWVTFLYTLSVFLSATSYFVAGNAGRISYYYALYGPVLYGALAKRSSSSKQCFYCALFLIAWFSFYAFYVFIFNDSGNILPYSFVWMS